MATAKKTVAKKATKKTAVKKAPVKRAYKRKAAPEVAKSVDVELASPVDTMQVEAAAPCPPMSMDLTEYETYDFSKVPLIGRALFLLELESRGYLMKSTLVTPTMSDTLDSSFLNLSEVFVLNHTNKLIIARQKEYLIDFNGVAASPTHFHGGFELIDVAVARSMPKTIRIGDVDYNRS